MTQDALTSLTRSAARGDSPRRQGAGATVSPPGRRLLTRVALPAGMLLAMAALFAYAGRDVLAPGRAVTVVRVVAREVSAQSGEANAAPTNGGEADANAAKPSPPPNSGRVAVQAPGWLEPDPYPTYITALTHGVIDKLLVLEGQRVEAGQMIATLVDDDAKLEAAKAKAELARQKALLAAARTHWEHPVALRRAVETGRARVAEIESELAQLDATIAQQQAKLRELETAHQRVRNLSSGAASKLEVETASFQVDAQRALVNATEKRRPVLEAQLRRHRADLAAAEEDLKLRVEHKRAVDEAAAMVDQAQATLDEANLRLSRMKITSPISGIVMNRLVAPGGKVTLTTDNQHSGHVAHVYDPQKLQVRVDVPLSDAAKVGVGQRAEVVVDVLPDRTFGGRVTRLVHLADISKNTVEVKVAIEDPSPILKPDMLARVKFFATRGGGGEGDASSGGQAGASSNGVGGGGGVMVFAPESSLLGWDKRSGDAAVWWVASGESRVQRRTVTVTRIREGDWLAVSEGLNPGDVLVVDPPPDLTDGQRVRIEKELSGDEP